LSEQIFISYRWTDSGQQVAPLADALAKWFGPSQVFHDKRSFQPGDKFDEMLLPKVNHAKAILVVIGPTWLKTLDERSKPNQALKQDWVRQEVKTALLRHKAGTLPLLMPILVGANPTVTLPEAREWPDALKSDLGALSSFLTDSVTLAGHGGTIADLRWAILTRAGVLPENSGALKLHLTDLGQELQQLLASGYGLQNITAQWKTAPIAPTEDTEVNREISRFCGAVEYFVPTWLALSSDQREAVAAGCRKVLALLYQMSVDVVICREWAPASKSHQPIAAGTLAAAINVRAAAEKLPMRLDATVGRELSYKGVANLDLTVAGVGTDEAAKAQRLVWANCTTNRTLGEPPGDGRVPFNAQELAVLKSAISHDMDSGKPHVLAKQVDPKSKVPESVRNIAAELGLPLVCFSDQQVKALRYEEFDIHNRIRACLDELQKLK
jgi:TIR domain